MKQNFQIKIFKIKGSHYELKNKSFEKSVEVIVANHKKHIHAGHDDVNVFNTQFETGEVEGFKFASYCYNQPIEKHYWRLFLPDFIGQDQDFNITKFSYVLFINYNSSIYCVIGGSGISVIKSYINPSFGIDVYSRLSKPNEDMVIEIKSRSIANNVSLQTTTYNFNQTVADTIEFSEIPSVMKIVIRDELKKGFFKQFKLDATQAILEIGSYFCLKKAISFTELLQLVSKLDHLIHTVEPVDLSFFKKIENEEVLEEIENKLIEIITQNVRDFTYQSTTQRNDIDIVHPIHLERFYECNYFKIRHKNSRGLSDIIITDRKQLYGKIIEHINSRLEGDFEDFNIVTEIYRTQINGLKNETATTFGTFLNHIVAELTLEGKKYFKIDKEWYWVKDIFLQKLTDTAIDYYTRYQLQSEVLKSWPQGINEGEYNLLHNSPNSFVLDKLLIDNIELCDVLIVEESRILFIHVKDGFDVKLRDCYIQVVLASKRLKVDLSDKNGENYFIPTLMRYNLENPTNQIVIDDILRGLAEASLNITFVLAFRNNTVSYPTATEKIRYSRSNIAKYSLVNVVKEMNEVYDIKLIDIDSIKPD